MRANELLGERVDPALCEIEVVTKCWNKIRVQSAVMKWIYFYKGSLQKALDMSVRDILDQFNTVDSTVQKTFPKVDRRLVLSLILDARAKEKSIYTVEAIIKPGQDTEFIRQDVINKTGMAPAFYLSGTKMIVSHMLDLDFLKMINDVPGVVSVKGSKYGAGGSTDF